MGSGYWSTDVYTKSATLRASTGKSAFDYNDTMHSRSLEEQKVHATLDPLDVKVRESRDNDDHPNSVPVAVIFDVTGSMQHVPRVMQETLPELVESLALKGLVEDGQILFGAVADAHGDRNPLQIGQFESDNRVEEHLGNIWFGGGGAQTRPPKESYELVFYFFAKHVVTDAWEKRGEKGYLFITGDESPYTAVNAQQVERIIGDRLVEDIPLEAIIAEVQERWHVYFVIPAETAYANDKDMRARWEALLGAESVLFLDNPKGLADLVAETVGASEDAIAAP